MADHTMTLQDIIEDIHALTEDCEVFERRYGVLTETFYESLMSGEEPPNEDWVRDWSAWAGAYKVLLRRRKQYHLEIEQLRQQEASLSNLIEKTALREPVSVAV